jgi:hypothetical protein
MLSPALRTWSLTQVTGVDGGDEEGESGDDNDDEDPARLEATRQRLEEQAHTLRLRHMTLSFPLIPLGSTCPKSTP